MNRLIYRIVCALLIASYANKTFAQSSPVDISYQLCENYRIAKEKVLSTPKNPYIISVQNQSDLASLNNEIISAINKGKKSIEVHISQGVFYYDKLPVNLYNLNAEDVSISIVGNNSILVAGGKDYKKGKEVPLLNNKRVYLGMELDLIELYEDVMQASGQVEVLNVTTKECRIPIEDEYVYKTGMKIQISEWFHSPVYEVINIKNGYVYFIAHDLKFDDVKKCYNVHYDNVVGKMNPRYRLYNPKYVINYPDYVHECKVSQFLSVCQVKLKSFSISGVDFCGSAKGESALLYFSEVESEGIFINNCHFENINQRVVKLIKTSNLVFKENLVENCYYGAFISRVDCSNTIVKNNRFYNTDKGWTNISCVVCFGEDFLIADNTFENTGYSSIRSGYHDNLGNEMITKGIIENNEIYFSDDYYSHAEKHTLIDGGAIYLGTFSDKVIVRYNYIHNYKGVKSNRAIYCDDGAMNVKIYGNVISGVTNSSSISSWRAKSVNKKFPQSNDGIDVFYNVIWGKYKFDERPNSSCIHGKNLILYGEGEEAPENVLNNFAYQEQDVVVSGAQMVDGKIKLTPEGLKELKALPTYPKIKQWFYESNTRPIKVRI